MTDDIYKGVIGRSHQLFLSRVLDPSTTYMRKHCVREKKYWGKTEKIEKRKKMVLVANNGVASQPPELRCLQRRRSPQFES